MFKFIPITSLLTGIPGSGYLSHAINLYLRCKSIFFPRTYVSFCLTNFNCHPITVFPRLTALLAFIYLSDKPDLHELQHFLEFQVPLQWAPMFNELVLGPQKRKGSNPSLQFRFLGPKLRVSTSQVRACLFSL